MWNWNEKYDVFEMNDIIDMLTDFVGEIVDERYNCGYFDTKEELIDWWVDHGFHRDDVEEWYEFLED